MSDERLALLGDAEAPPGDRYFAAMFLAGSGTPHHFPVLATLLREANGDIRVAAAYALLTIDACSTAGTPASHSKGKK